MFDSQQLLEGNEIYPGTEGIEAINKVFGVADMVSPERSGISSFRLYGRLVAIKGEPIEVKRLTTASDNEKEVTRENFAIIFEDGAAMIIQICTPFDSPFPYIAPDSLPVITELIASSNFVYGEA